MNGSYPDLPKSPETLTLPEIVRVNHNSPCLQCGCKTTQEMKVKVKVPTFKDAIGIGRYARCPQCGWRSPMDVLEG